MFVLSLWFGRGPKYQNIIKVSKSVWEPKVSKYRLYRLRFLRGFRHFSAFFTLYPNNLQKTRQNFRKCENPSHQISEISRKWAKSVDILIFWRCSILWYFAWFLYFHFEFFENLQPVRSILSFTRSSTTASTKPRRHTWRPGQLKLLHSSVLSNKKWQF